MAPTSEHHRRSIRLQGYDYSQTGAYFVTIVAWQRECLFGEIVNGEMKLNRMGQIAQKWWHEIPRHFPNVILGAFVIMPNHVHGIIIILADGRGAVPAPCNEPNSNATTYPQKEEIIVAGNKTAEQDLSLQRGGETPPLQRPALGQVVAYFKYQSTKEMNTLDGSGVVTKFWQRNYYEHIIRNEREMDNIWRYIEANPSAWEKDEENPHHSEP
jgi:REP element-mobilizing transposase RayT